MVPEKSNQQSLITKFQQIQHRFGDGSHTMHGLILVDHGIYGSGWKSVAYSRMEVPIQDRFGDSEGPRVSAQRSSWPAHHPL